MLTIKESIINSVKYFTTMGIADIADILIMAFVIYKIVMFIIRTDSYRVAKGVVVLLLALWLSGVLKLHVVNFMLRKAVEIGLVAIVVLFQPELRRVLEKVGTSRLFGLFGKKTVVQDMDSAITQTVIACSDMSKTKTGVLIIFERDNYLGDQMNTGTIVDASVTAELLKNIFYPKAPLHDGAVIIRGGRVAAAGCMLPLSNNNNLSRDLGMRHRAGIGMSERSDAVVVIVSEETGSISVAVEGMLKRHLAVDTFEKLLRNELTPEPEETENALARFTNIFKVKKQ